MNLDDLSDDDILNMSEDQLAAITADAGGSDDGGNTAGDDVSDDETPSAEDNGEGDEGSTPNDDESGEAANEEVQGGDTSELSDDELGKEPPAPAKAVENSEPTNTEAPAKEAAKEGEQGKEGGEAAEEATATVDYKAAYDTLIGTPIKANGREIVIKSVDEARRLIQQGANYNKKMEDLKPLRKIGAMLEQAGLANDELAVAQMIDLFNGKPEAWAKAAKDLNIDILSLDMDSGDKYSPNHHLQSDELVTFRETLAEIKSEPQGPEALAIMDKWDAASRKRIWGKPAELREMYGYMQDGVYDIVANEVERRKVLGLIPEGTPFLDSFIEVGNELGQQRAAEAASTAAPAAPVQTQQAAAAATERVKVATGAAPRKPSAAVDPRAAAASAPRNGGGNAKPSIDIYSLSDDDIMKMSAPPM